jgi:REP element-mobilizing transposase RayT
VINDPLAYFLTWHTYGTWLHGDAAGSIDAAHNQFGSHHIGDHPKRRERAMKRMNHPPLILDPSARTAVEGVIAKHCEHRKWLLRASSVRSNHVHIVVNAPKTAPEEVVRQLKQWGTRTLRELGFAGSDQRVWADHASTKYLFDQSSVDAAVRYTIESQDRNADHLRSSDARKE